MTGSRKSLLAGIGVITVTLIPAFWQSSPWLADTVKDSPESLATMQWTESVKRSNRPLVTKNTDFQVRVGSIKAHLSDPEGWLSIEPWLNLTFQESPDLLCRVFDELLGELESGSSWEKSNVATNLATITVWMHCEKKLKGADEKLYASATDDLLPAIEASWLPAVTPGNSGKNKYYWTFETRSKLSATDISKERRDFLLRLYGASVVSENGSQLDLILKSLPTCEQETLMSEVRDVRLIEGLSSLSN